MNLNKVFILGRLTADPQLRATAGGNQVASFSLATNRVWNDKSGARKESTEFHNIVVWGKQAEVASRFLTKGSLALIEGRMQTRDWVGKDGQKRRITEIICEKMQLGPKPVGVAGKGKWAVDAPVKEAIPTIDVDADSAVLSQEEIKSEDLQF